MWVVLAAELANPGRLPHGSVLLPVACAFLFWLRSASGLMITGGLLLLDWVARPSMIPLCPMLVPLLAVVCLAPSTRSDEYTTGGRWFRIPTPLQLPLLTLLAVILQMFGRLSTEEWLTIASRVPVIVESLYQTLVIALPVSALLSLFIRVADEFGMRRVFLQG